VSDLAMEFAKIPSFDKESWNDCDPGSQQACR